MPDGQPQDALRGAIERRDAERRPAFAALDRRLAQAEGIGRAGTIADFGARLEGGKYDFFEAGAQAFLELLEQHPDFGADRELDIALPALGPEGAHESRFRHDAAEILARGAIAIGGIKGPTPEYIDALVKVAFSPDSFSDRLRDVLLGGKPLPDFEPPRIPQKWLDLARDIERRTCVLGLVHALHDWGAAVQQAKSTAWATGIASLSPATGCAGTAVTISGSGFGASQPQGTVVAFAKRGGGCSFASVVSWADTAIVVTAPQDVGAGCVGFVRPGDPGELAGAASSLAGEMVRCIGLSAFTASEKIRTVGSRPIMACPPCLPNGANYFSGGLPYIRFFSANGWDEAEIAPNGMLTLSWSVDNATSVEIVKLPPAAGQADELPGIAGPFSNTAGTYTTPSVPGTFTWDRQYELRARNACTGATPVTRRVTVRMRNRPNLTVNGIEATQATQFFAAAVHMPNAAARKADNAISLIAGKPAVVRVFVDSGQSATFDGGVVKGVRARLHGRSASGATLPGSPLAPLNASFVASAGHSIDALRRTPLTAQVVADERMLPARRSFLFRLPASWAGVGAIDVEAEVIPPAGVRETNALDNKLSQRLVFSSGGLPIRIALLRVSYNDTAAGGAFVSPPTLAQSFAELDFLQRAYPSNRSLLNVVTAAGGSPWFFGGDLTAGGPGCGMGWNAINVELATRAFFNLGFEDRVFVALLNRPPSGNAGPASGCGMPMSSLGGTVIGGAVIGGLVAGTVLLGPFAGLAVAAIVARLGSAALGVCSALVAAAGTTPGTGGTLAQEVGHALGLMHIPGASAPAPFEGAWPDYQGVGSGGANFQSIGEFGLDIDDSAGFTLRSYSPRSLSSYSPTTDFMSYAAASNWVSPYIYEKTMSGTIVPPPGSGPSPGRPLSTVGEEIEPLEIALVSGIIDENGVELLPAFSHTRRFRFDEPDAQWYRLELHAGDGSVLEARPIRSHHEHLEDVHDRAHGDGEHRPHSHRLHKPELPFAFSTAIPWHPRTARLVVLGGDEELASRDVPAEAPAVQRPHVRETEQGWEVEWALARDDGDDVRYLVRYAVAELDGEPLWQFLAAGLTEPRFSLERGALAGGEARVQVGASVAGRTAWVESEPFHVPAPPPEAAVLWPLDKARLPVGPPATLRGEAVLPEPEPIADEHFRWMSSRDGELGTGRTLETRLSVGEHDLTLRVEAPDRPPAAATVHVYVTQRKRDRA